ncbi:MAG: hypothetical protein PHX18_01740 [Candidatus Gastranaerophilales bacterium]|nr:hypothetical protein [Candidatus Gastranaerophilales bacterium]
MRYLLAFIMVIMLISPCLAKDKAYDKNIIYDEILDASNYEVVKYNFPPGSRELNLFGLRNAGQYNLNAVASPDFQYLAYSEIYYYGQPEITASSLYLIVLDTALSQKDAILSVSTADKELDPVIKTNMIAAIPYKFNTFTVVDWNGASDKILIKEKMGKNRDQVYETRIYVYDLTTAQLYDLNPLREAVKYFWENRKIFLDDYKWDIKPLGFDSVSQEQIVALAYGYHGDERKFLGAWSIDYQGTKTKLISLTKEDPPVSSNGFCLKFLKDMSDLEKQQKKEDEKEPSTLVPAQPQKN